MEPNMRAIFHKAVDMEEEDTFIRMENGLKGNLTAINWFICIKFPNEEKRKIFYNNFAFNDLSITKIF